MQAELAPKVLSQNMYTPGMILPGQTKGPQSKLESQGYLSCSYGGQTSSGEECSIGEWRPGLYSFLASVGGEGRYGLGKGVGLAAKAATDPILQIHMDLGQQIF